MRQLLLATGKQHKSQKASDRRKIYNLSHHHGFVTEEISKASSMEVEVRKSMAVLHDRSPIFYKETKAKLRNETKSSYCPVTPHLSCNEPGQTLWGPGGLKLSGWVRLLRVARKRWSQEDKWKLCTRNNSEGQKNRGLPCAQDQWQVRAWGSVTGPRSSEDRNSSGRERDAKSKGRTLLSEGRCWARAVLGCPQLFSESWPWWRVCSV